MYFNLYRSTNYRYSNHYPIIKRDNVHPLFNYNKTLTLCKKVRFNTIASVILIPSRNEYKFFGLINELWYTEKDYIFFYKNRFNS